MKAIRVAKYGGPEELQLQEVAQPEPGAGDRSLGGTEEFQEGCVAKMGQETSSDSDGGAWLASLVSEAKCPIDELVLRQDVTLLHPSNLTFADLMDHFVALNC